MEDKDAKVERVLGIYTRLMNGYIVNKAEEADRYNVHERSIQRDIDDIRNYLDNEATINSYQNTVIYDREKKGYRLEQLYRIRLTNSEVLAICKILLDCRAFTKKEMTDLIDRLIGCCVPKSNQKLVRELVKSEEYHYVQPKHGKVFINTMWDIGNAINEHRYIEIKYKGNQGSSVKTRKLMPLAIMFSEYYFYLGAFIDDCNVRENFDVINDAYPTIYRIDKINKLQVLEERYRVPYSNKFEEGEFRKRVQFMYGGRLQKIKFKYLGFDVNAVLDRLPTSQILDEENFTDETGKERKAYIISAEVFGKGIDMWIRSQGDNIELVENKSL